MRESAAQTTPWQPSETDLAVLGALEADPRAPWSSVGTALGVSASTAARRWADMEREHVAWVTVVPGPAFIAGMSTAFVRLAVRPARRAAVLENLCADPVAATISTLDGHWHVLVDCFAPSPEELAEAIRRFTTWDGVTEADPSRAVVVHRNGTRWVSGTITAAQRARLAAAPTPAVGSSAADATDRALLEVLTRDGRSSWADLGDECGVSPQTARRRVRRLIGGGHAELRCDSTLHPSGLRQQVTILLNIPLHAVDDVVRRLAHHPACRLVAEVLGEQNVLSTLWVHDFGELAQLEREIGRISPDATLTAQLVNLHTVKRAGRVLDERGRWTTITPFAMWRRDSPAGGAGRSDQQGPGQAGPRL